MDYKKIQSYTFIGALLGITAVFGWMLRPYVYAIFWAAVLATLFYPVYLRLLRATQRPNASAGLTLGLIIVIVLLPVAGIVSLIIQQAISLYHNFGNQASVDTFSSTLQQIVQWGPLQRWTSTIDLSERLSAIGSSLSQFVYQLVASGGQNTVRGIIQFFIMLYTLYYFLRDGGHILKRLMHLLPLGDRYEEQLYNRFVSTTRATLKGTLLIGAVQGSIGGLAFVITGVPAAAFWGLIMVVLSIIPGIGASLVLIPAAIIMLLTGQVWPAVVILVAMVMAGVIDNFLRGPLVGKDTQMHPLFIFFATLGGLLAFGFSGIVIGPVLTAFLLSMWQMYEQKYHADLDRPD
ncbi:MAG: AI-2E family transporter [Candidatus Kerfeldbacteria bacterium]|nr:AI-2E family transporter [Candidatus Kerfeldbacteria bacterium]